MPVVPVTVKDVLVHRVALLHKEGARELFWQVVQRFFDGLRTGCFTDLYKVIAVDPSSMFV